VAQLRDSIPFAVCGANAMVEVGGKKVRGRQYPWGVVEVENPEHCDFVKLRSMLITHMQDLQEVSSAPAIYSGRQKFCARPPKTMFLKMPITRATDKIAKFCKQL
jgi:hypothetical protein